MMVEKNLDIVSASQRKDLGVALKSTGQPKHL